MWVFIWAIAIKKLLLFKWSSACGVKFVGNIFAHNLMTITWKVIDSYYSYMWLRIFTETEFLAYLRAKLRFVYMLNAQSFFTYFECIISTDSKCYDKWFVLGIYVSKIAIFPVKFFFIYWNHLSVPWLTWHWCKHGECSFKT